MPAITKQSSERSVQPSVEMTAWRFRFLDDLPAGAEAYRRFVDPRNVYAVRDTATDFFAPPVWPAGFDSLQVVCVTETGALGAKLQSWMGKADDPQAVTTLTLETELGKIRWRPGRAVIHGSAAECGDLIAGLVEFSFLEGELRQLEQAIVPHQLSAERDVALAYNIRAADRSQWARLSKTMEALYTLRLQFARLEPNLYQSARTLPAEARRVFARLTARADIEARLEALNDRMETCEDLYEGAIDRITDHRNYRKGNFLEIAIVILLALEVALLLIHH